MDSGEFVWRAPEACPVCGDALYISRLSCHHCGSAVEGAFQPVGTTSQEATRDGQRAANRLSGPLGAIRDESRFGRLARLSDEQLEFVEVFLRCRGVIKNVEDMLGVSYPTVRARLNATFDAMGFAAEDEPALAEQRRARREILADLRDGRIGAEEAHEQLARLQALGDDDR